MQKEISEILEENRRRNEERDKVFNPITGEGVFLERDLLEISDFSIPRQYVPKGMFKIRLVRELKRYGSIRKFIEKGLKAEYSENEKEKVVWQFIRIRNKYDFCFWAFTFARIKNKEGGEDIPFKLNRPQRRLIERYERMRLAGKPIRLILLKARQWGGSTATQVYMAWIQLCHMTGWNSLVVAHTGAASSEVKGMFDKLISHYPTRLLHKEGDPYAENETKIKSFGNTGNIDIMPQRNNKIKLGTALAPESARGGDSAMVHCSEVAFWNTTEKKTPEQLVRSACSGTLYKPLTMIIYESTANGTGNFFQKEYDDAKAGKSVFEALFIAWFDIELYALDLEDTEGFATRLWENRENNDVADSRSESGKYLWGLWKQGATLESINWYIHQRTEFTDHADMAAEYPSNDLEAFKHSGARVFDDEKVERFREACRPPKFIGDVYADGDEGKAAFKNLRFREDKQGILWIWQLPEKGIKVSDRYITTVDVGGRGKKADWSVIRVFDRYWMMEGGKPSLVAQWYGHIDHDLLAWKAAQIAAFYNNALLVIESNTLETKDKEHEVDGDQTGFILDQIKDCYDNLYARKQSAEDIRNSAPVKYGFHTNVSTKPAVISLLVKVVREGLYIERDERCLSEYLCYERKQNGSFGAIIGKHDDLLMATGIGLWVCFMEMELPKIINKNKWGVRSGKTISAATL